MTNGDTMFILGTKKLIGHLYRAQIRGCLHGYLLFLPNTPENKDLLTMGENLFIHHIDTDGRPPLLSSVQACLLFLFSKVTNTKTQLHIAGSREQLNTKMRYFCCSYRAMRMYKMSMSLSGNDFLQGDIADCPKVADPFLT